MRGLGILLEAGAETRLRGNIIILLLLSVNRYRERVLSLLLSALARLTKHKERFLFSAPFLASNSHGQRELTDFFERSLWQGVAIPVM